MAFVSFERHLWKQGRCVYYFEFVWFNQFEVCLTVLVFGEVEDQVPLVALCLGHAVIVDEGTDELGCICVRFQKRILEVVGREREIRRRLDDGVIGRVQEDRRIREVPAPELRAANGDFAVVTVSEKD